MVLSGLCSACKPHFSLRPPFFRCFRKIGFDSVAAIETLDEPETFVKENSSQSSNFSPGKNENSKLPQWKKLNSEDLGISTSKISKPTRKVLNGLKRKGLPCRTRDLILKRTPQDFDVITAAELREVTKAFSRCEVVGKRFPVCHVHIGDTIVEVSSFSTSGPKFGRGLTFEFGRPAGCDKKDFIHWRNCLQRDFTFNGVMFDPFARIIYGYMGGIEDLKKKLKETAHFVKNLSCLIMQLDKSRLLLEMNYLVAYGSGEASLRLLWKFGLLEILVPIQAEYFVRNGFWRPDKRSNMLLIYRKQFDKHRDPVVVAAFSLTVHNGGDLPEAINIARRFSRSHDSSFNELSEPRNLENQILTKEVVDLAASVKSSLSKMTDEYFVSQAMSAYPQAPVSDLVFIPLALYLKVCKVFECMREGADKRFVTKQGSSIDYDLLALGSPREIRHIFALVVFDTIHLLNRKIN